MKILLTIFCVLVILFAGGCTLLLANGGGGVMFFIPLVVIGLNLAVIAALWGFGKPARWVFIVLAVLDAIVVANIIVFWASVGWGEPDLNMLTLLTALAFTAKGILSVAVLKDLKSPSGTTTTQGEQ